MDDLGLSNLGLFLRLALQGLNDLGLDDLGMCPRLTFQGLNDLGLDDWPVRRVGNDLGLASRTEMTLPLRLVDSVSAVSDSGFL